MAVLLFVLLFAGLASGILQSEAGRNDWRLRHVGKVDFAVPSQDGHRYFVGTKEGVIASLLAEDGSLEWRHELSGTLYALSRCSDGFAVLSTTHVQQWTEEGFLGWQVALPTPILSGPSHPSLACSNTGLLVTTPSAVLALQQSGAEVWAHQAAANWTLLAAAKHDKQTMLVAEYDGDRSVRLSSLLMPARDSGQEQLFTLSAAPDSCVMTSSTLYCCVNGKAVAATLGADELTPLGACDTLAPHPKGLAVVAAEDSVRIYHGTVLAQTLPAGTAVASASGHLYALVPSPASEIRLFSLDGKATQEAALPVSLPDATHVAALFVVASSASAPSVLVRHADDTLQLVRNSKAAWSRPEYLAHTLATIFADFLSPKTDVPLFETGVFSHAARRLSSHAAALASLFSGTSTPAARDAFNLHQRIVVASATGVLAGLDSGTGELAYHTAAFATPVTVTRASLVALHADGLSSPLYALVARIAADDTLHVVLFDPLSGALVSTHTVGDVLAYGRVALKDHSHSSPLVVLSEGAKLTVFPDTPETHTALAAHVASHPTTLYRAEAVNGLFEGFLVTAAKDGSLTASPSWRIVFDPRLEPVVATASRHANDVIASLGDIIPDGKVLYKYLSPHLLAVATLTPADPREGGLLTLYVIDTVKGSIVDRVSHENAQGPVHVVHADNWFVYSFRDKKNRRWQLNTLDLFDSAGKPPSEGLSSLRLSKPIAMSQAFVFLHAITRLGVTVTDASLANRAVIVALASGKIAALSDRLLDSRRPIGQGPRTEEMVPYHPVLVVDPLSLLNYNHTVAGVSRITCAPTNLESTSLVLATGLDTFFTHVAPSKRFDSLSADFNKPILLLSLIVLAGVTLAAKWKLQDTALRAAWE
eukprot:m.25635 g.25635  ORF g.25635 m.25635 type:complete len:877 (+) comp8873_c1_seq1:23-2653(+)